MATIKISTTETKEREIEVTFPHFRKDNVNIYKIYSEESAICVCKSYLEITRKHSGLAYLLDSGKDSTESEFLDAYNEVKNELEKLATS